MESSSWDWHRDRKWANGTECIAEKMDPFIQRNGLYGWYIPASLEKGMYPIISEVGGK